MCSDLPTPETTWAASSELAGEPRRWRKTFRWRWNYSSRFENSPLSIYAIVLAHSSVIDRRMCLDAVIHGIATHSLYVIIEVQMFVKRHVEQLNFGCEFNFDSADRQGVDAGVVPVMPNWTHMEHLGFVRIQRHSVEGEPGLNLQCAFGQPLDLSYSIIAWNSDKKRRVVRILVLLHTEGSGDVGDRGDKRWKQQRSKDRSLRNADHTLSRGRALSVDVDDLWSPCRYRSLRGRVRCQKHTPYESSSLRMRSWWSIMSNAADRSSSTRIVARLNYRLTAERCPWFLIVLFRLSARSCRQIDNGWNTVISRDAVEDGSESAFEQLPDRIKIWNRSKVGRIIEIQVRFLD